MAAFGTGGGVLLEMGHALAQGINHPGGGRVLGMTGVVGGAMAVAVAAAFGLHTAAGTQDEVGVVGERQVRDGAVYFFLTSWSRPGICISVWLRAAPPASG